MDSMHMDRSYGTKWFTFYAKVRPWIVCINILIVLRDFCMYANVYIAYWWLMLYFLGAIVQATLAIMVFVKSRGDYRDFVKFVKGVLLFESVYLVYNDVVEVYVNKRFDVGLILIATVIKVIFSILWYCLNIEYFRKRLIVTENADESSIVSQNYTSNQISEVVEPVFCRACGSELIGGSKFCDQCGAEVIDVNEKSNL